MKITKFEEIKSWQEAKILVGLIYKVSKENRFKVDYALVEQIRKAGISVMANIAEGFDCSSNLEFAKFLSYSQRSCSEIQSHLYIALEQKYIEDAQFEEMYQKCSQVKNLIGGFIKYIKNSKRTL
ncbi:MAG: four helix bundle protein [Candidatus Omnitrophota bacterium]